MARLRAFAVVDGNDSYVETEKGWTSSRGDHSHLLQILRQLGAKAVKGDLESQLKDGSVVDITVDASSLSKLESYDYTEESIQLQLLGVSESDILLGIVTGKQDPPLQP